MRWWIRCRALEEGLVGYAKNLSDGRVEVAIVGTLRQRTRLIDQLREAQPGHLPPLNRPGRIDGLTVHDPKDVDERTYDGFDCR